MSINIVISSRLIVIWYVVTAGCESIGLDVSPPCIEMAKRVANEERLEDLCQFHEADVTIDPDLLLSGTCRVMMHARYCRDYPHACF